MSMNLYELELSNLEDAVMHKPSDGSSNKRSENHRKLAARRAIEDHLERQRLRNEYQDLDLEIYQ